MKEFLDFIEDMKLVDLQLENGTSPSSKRINMKQPPELTKY